MSLEAWGDEIPDSGDDDRYIEAGWLTPDEAAALHEELRRLRGAGGGPTHLHVKGGNRYFLLGYGSLERDCSDVAIYMGPDGHLWVRSKDEFDDGRFTALPTTPGRFTISSMPDFPGHGSDLPAYGIDDLQANAGRENYESTHYDRIAVYGEPGGAQLRDRILALLNHAATAPTSPPIMGGPEITAAIAAAIKLADDKFTWGMELTRLVDGISTYQLRITDPDWMEIREFDDRDALYEYLRVRKAEARAVAILNAVAAFQQGAA